MARLTIVFGALLTAVGIVGYIFTGGIHSVFFGIVLIICGLAANTENSRKRMLWMHIAVTIGLLGFLVPGTMSAVQVAQAHNRGIALPYPARVDEQVIVALICLVFVILCVRSFIAARRARVV
jgi:mannitol-specific phosphotransferase system IIBC component